MAVIITAIKVLWWVSLGTILYTYVVYPLVLFVLAKFFKKDHFVDYSYLPTVGFLIPVYNEEKVIGKKIRNVLSLDYPPEKISIWIGSDCSTDRTELIVKSLIDARIHLWRAPCRMGKTGIINHLAPHVDAEVIVFTDANTIHTTNSLRELVCHFADPQVGGVAGHVEHAGRTGNIIEEVMYRTFEAQQKSRESQLHSSVSAFGGFYAIRKELFVRIPNNAYSNDDVLIPMNIIRRNFRVIYTFDAISSEETTEDLQKEFKRRVRIGTGNFQAFFWLLDFLNPLKGWLSFCFVSHKVIRWFSPLLLLLCFSCCTIIVILTGAMLYAILLAAGIVFLIVGFSYLFFASPWNRKFFYFLAMNMALVIGFFRYLTGISSAAWERTDRSKT